jgi:hypothetical protein
MLFRKLLFSLIVCASVQAFALTPEMIEARKHCVVVISGSIEKEVEKQKVIAVGAVTRNAIVCPSHTFPIDLPPSWFKDLKVHLCNEPDSKGIALDYLGQDSLFKNHYFSIPETLKGILIPIESFGSGEIALGEAVWSIDLFMSKEIDYALCVNRSYLSWTVHIPFAIGTTGEALGSPGSVVFDKNGNFVGVVAEERPQFALLEFLSEPGRIEPVQVRTEKSNQFLFAKDFFKWITRVPSSPICPEASFLGFVGVRPVESDVLEWIGVPEGSGAVLVSEIAPGGPASKAGVQAGDIIVGIDGASVASTPPASTMVNDVHFRIASRKPGTSLTLDILRHDKISNSFVPIKITAQTEQYPREAKDVRRTFFSKLGISVREPVWSDGIRERELSVDVSPGVIISFIAPTSTLTIAHLEEGDWVKSINGQPIVSYEQACQLLTELEGSVQASEHSLLVLREGKQEMIRFRVNGG